MNNFNYKKAGLYYTFGSFFNKGIAFLTVPIFTHLLTIKDYGVVSTYNAAVSIVSILIGMALYMAIRSVAVDHPDKLDEYHSTITIFINGIAGSILVLLIVIQYASAQDLILPIFCIIQSYSSALIENYSMYLMMKYKYKNRTLLMVLPNFISAVIATILISLINMDKLYIMRIIPSVIISLVFAIMINTIVFKKDMTFNFSYLKYSLKFSTPLIFHGMMLFVLAQSDRIMITYFISEEKTAIYSVVYNLSMVATALTAGLNGIWSPWYLDKIKDENFDEINEKSKDYIGFMTLLMCGLTLLSPEIMKLISPKEYWEGFYIIPPIILSNLIIFIYTFYVEIEYFNKKTKIIAQNTLIAAMINIILNYILIPKYGYEAAAYTTLFSYAISLLIHYYSAIKLEKQINRLNTYIVYFAQTSLVIVLYYIFLKNSIMRWSIAITLAIISLIPLMKKYKFLLKKKKE